MTASGALQVVPTGTVGAAIRGVDVARATGSEIEAIKKAWYAHGVLVFPGQKLSDEDLLTFSRNFGALDPPRKLGSTKNRSPAKYPDIYVVSNVLDDAGVPIGDLGNMEVLWHSDMSYNPDPPDASMTYSLELPQSGGDTYFSCMRQALASLPPALRERVWSLDIKHDASVDAAGRVRLGFTLEDPRISQGARHPIVIEHPVTGAPTLYLGRRANAYVVGLEVPESEALLDELWAHATAAVYQHRWSLGDLVLWDNRAVMHRRDSFDQSQRRTLHRTQIKGTTIPRRARHD